MTAKQFWKEHFPQKKATIFEVMEAYAALKEQQLKKELLQQNDRIKKEFEDYKNNVRGN